MFKNQYKIALVVGISLSASISAHASGPQEQPNCSDSTTEVGVTKKADFKEGYGCRPMERVTVDETPSVYSCDFCGYKEYEDAGRKWKVAVYQGSLSSNKVIQTKWLCSNSATPPNTYPTESIATFTEKKMTGSQTEGACPPIA